jgi:hypothetical protein
MTTHTLHQFTSNPKLIESILVEKNLNMHDYPVAEWQKLVPTEDGFAFCEGRVLSANIKIYSMLSESLFYSILFPDYSDSQISQLKSLFALVNNVLKEKDSTYNPYNRFMFMNGSLTANTKSISVIYKNNRLWLTSYANSVSSHNIALDDLSFETLYTTILGDFNQKVSALLNIELPEITVNSMAKLQVETNEELIQRTHKSRIVNAIKVDEFKKHIDSLNLPIQSVPYDVKNKSWDINSMYVIDVYGNDKFSVGIRKINKLKMMLAPLMSESHINTLIQLLSVAQFYSSLLHTDYANNCIEFSQTNLFSLSKEQLSLNPTYLEFSIGVFDFLISEKFKIDNFGGEKKDFFTIDEAYVYLLDFVQQDICQHLSADISDISNKDLLVLDMITC